MKKLLFIASLSLLCSPNFAAGAGKIIDLLINQSGITKIVGKASFDSTMTGTAKSQIELSIKALIGDDSIPTRASILKAIGEIEDTPENTIIKRSLARTLSKDLDDVAQDDVVKLMNDLITLAGVRNSLFTACGECALGPLAAEGIRVSLKEIKDASILQLIKNNVVPTSPRKLSQFINNKMKRMGLGSLKDAPQGLVQTHDREALAFFLALAQEGSSTQKAYINAVIEFSQTPGGKTLLLDQGNPHKLWAIFLDEKYTPGTIAQLTDVIREAAKRGKDQNLSNKTDVFYDIIDERARAIPDANLRSAALRDAATIRANKCLVGK